MFGVVLVNDWSARDIQAFEYQPLGPFLGKSFATSVSPWVVPLAALDPWRVRRSPSGPGAGRLICGRTEPRGLDVHLELAINGEIVSDHDLGGSVLVHGPAAGAPHRQRRRGCGPATSSRRAPSRATRRAPKGR